MATETDAGKPKAEENEVGSTEAQNDFADLLNRVAYKGERIWITRHGKRVARLIPVEASTSTA